jgi:uncharacterized membrane protein HdeD (DUF308 family)
MADDESRSALDVLRGSRILAYTVGTLAAVAGLVLLFWPDRTIVVVARLAGILIICVGVAEAFDAITTHRKGSYWGFLLVRGLVNIVFGALLLFWGDITITVLVWLFGLDLMITGVIGLFVMRDVPKDMGRNSLLLRSGVAIVIGLLVVVWPDVTLKIIAIIVAIQLLLVGALLLYSGWALGRVEKEVAT